MILRVVFALMLAVIGWNCSGSSANILVPEFHGAGFEAARAVDGTWLLSADASGGWLDSKFGVSIAWVQAKQKIVACFSADFLAQPVCQSFPVPSDEPRGDQPEAI